MDAIEHTGKVSVTEMERRGGAIRLVMDLSQYLEGRMPLGRPFGAPQYFLRESSPLV